MTWQVFGPRYLALYAASFTADELRQMNAFDETPVGRKALTLMPEMTRRSVLLASKVAQQHIGELQQMIRARATGLGCGCFDGSHSNDWGSIAIGIIAWIIVGLIAGWGAGKVMKRGGMIGSIIVAFIGAVILIWIMRLIKKA